MQEKNGENDSQNKGSLSDSLTDFALDITAPIPAHRPSMSSKNTIKLPGIRLYAPVYKQFNEYLADFKKSWKLKGTKTTKTNASEVLNSVHSTQLNDCRVSFNPETSVPLHIIYQQV